MSPAILAALRFELSIALRAAALAGAPPRELAVLVDADRWRAHVALREHCPPLPPVDGQHVPCVVRSRGRISIIPLALSAWGVG